MLFKLADRTVSQRNWLKFLAVRRLLSSRLFRRKAGTLSLFGVVGTEMFYFNWTSLNNRWFLQTIVRMSNR